MVVFGADDKSWNKVTDAMGRSKVADGDFTLVLERKQVNR